MLYITFSYIVYNYITKEVLMERLLTTEEVAELLRVDPVTVRRLVTRGELIGYRIAGEYRFTEAGVENFVESQRVVVSMAPGPDHPMSRFTERARRVLSLATEEVQRYHHDGVGTEHILLAIMSEGGGIGAVVLSRLGVQPGEVRKQIEGLHPAGEEMVSDGQIGMAQVGKTSIELAVQEARALGHHYLGTEHLLLGLVREEAGLASQILLKSGVTLEKARELVKQVLAEQEPKAEEMGKA
jgi:excisionase family DNA binding protein